MVIGRGLVAKAFQFYEQDQDILIYAAGVSDSKSGTDKDFLREQELLASSIHNNPDYRIVYFSTTSVNDPDLRETPYVRHKVRMEELIRQQAAHYHIFRLSNLAGHSANPGTILNFLVGRISREQPFELWKYSERNLIDVADVFRIGRYILENNLFPNQIVNIANEQNYPVREIIRAIESHTGKLAVFTEKDKGGAFRIDISAILPICASLGLRFEENYLRNLLETYYPKL